MTPAPGLLVTKGHFAGIDLDNAFAVLMKEDSSFFGHKQILLEGICAWMKQSRDMATAQRAIAKATGRHVAAAEKEIARELESWRRNKASPLRPRSPIASQALASMSVGTRSEYRDFYNRLYLQIGGMAAVTAAYKNRAKYHKTKKQKKRSRPQHQSGIRYLVCTATVLDFSKRELDIPKPSMAKAGALAYLLASPPGGPHAPKRKPPLGVSQFNELLAEHRNALALLYGADRLTIQSGLSLLDCLLQKNPSQDQISPHIPTWLAYAGYFFEEVLSEMKGQWSETYCPSIAGCERQKPQLPHIAPAQKGKIEAALKSSEARPQFKSS